MDACTDSTCINNCIMNDMTAPTMTSSGAMGGLSRFCLSYTQEYCIEQNGGSTVLHAYNCCISRYHSCIDQTCVMTNCSAEQMAVFSSA